MGLDSWDLLCTRLASQMALLRWHQRDVSLFQAGLSGSLMQNCGLAGSPSPLGPEGKKTRQGRADDGEGHPGQHRNGWEQFI